MAEKAGPPLVARLIAAAVYARACRSGSQVVNDESGAKRDLAAESMAVTTQLCKTMTSLCLNRDNGRLFATFGILGGHIIFLLHFFCFFFCGAQNNRDS